VQLSEVLRLASSDTSSTAAVTPPSQYKTPKMYQVDLFLSQKGMRVEDSIDKASKMREDGAIDVRFIVQISIFLTFAILA